MATVIMDLYTNFHYVLSFPIEEKNEQLRQDAERERIELLRVMEEHKRMAHETSEKLKQRHQTYQRDLEMQIGYQKTMKARENQEELDDYLAGKVSQ